MKNILNKKGFTLIELLAVIVILGIIMLIAIPSITQYITTSRQDATIASARSYIKFVKTEASNGTFTLPLGQGAYTVVTSDHFKTDNNLVQSGFNQKWLKEKTYVIIKNISNTAEPVYEYYFQGQDAAGNQVTLTKESELNRSLVKNGLTLKDAPTDAQTGWEDSAGNTYSAAAVLNK